MAIFFTSDLHFGSETMITDYNRPKKTPTEMDELIIKNWNSTVSYSDKIYILGDISDKDLNHTTELLDRLHGKKYLIVGNHDECYIKSSEFRKRFLSIDHYKRIQIGKYDLVLSHYPFYKWEGKGRGYIHLYGHIHDKQLQDKLGFCYNVGIDANNYRPISFEKILIAMKYPKNILPFIKMRGNCEEIFVNDKKITNADELYNVIKDFKTEKECEAFLAIYQTFFENKSDGIRNIIKVLRIKHDTKLRTMFSKI